LEEGDAAAEEFFFGKFDDGDDLRGNENGDLADDVRNGDFDERAFVVGLFAFEAQPAAGHVLAEDDVVSALWMADEGGVVDLGARMLAALLARSVGLLDRGQRHGENRGARKRGKFHAPEIQVGINEGEAVSMDAIGGAHFADDADGSFAVAIGATKDELLFGRNLVMRNDAGAVEAEEDGVGRLREDFAVEIAADQEDGNFFRDAASDTHNLQWQVTSQRRGRGGTFWYLIV
jgi:hypothetical protein